MGDEDQPSIREARWRMNIIHLSGRQGGGRISSIYQGGKVEDEYHPSIREARWRMNIIHLSGRQGGG